MFIFAEAQPLSEGRSSQIDNSTQPMTRDDDSAGATNQRPSGRAHSPNFTRRATGRNTENEYPGLNRFQPVRGGKHELRGRAHLPALKHLRYPTSVLIESEIKDETVSRRDYDPEYRSKFDYVNVVSLAYVSQQAWIIIDFSVSTLGCYKPGGSRLRSIGSAQLTDICARTV